MAYIHKHSKGEWMNTTDGEANYFGIATKENWLLRVQQNGEKDVKEQEANMKLISQANRLLEFAEMHLDYWKSKKGAKPMFLGELEKVIINSGVEITDEEI